MGPRRLETPFTGCKEPLVASVVGALAGEGEFLLRTMAAVRACARADAASIPAVLHLTTDMPFRCVEPYLQRFEEANLTLSLTTAGAGNDDEGLVVAECATLQREEG